jgi:hypothetical protein
MGIRQTFPTRKWRWWGKFINHHVRVSVPLREHFQDQHSLHFNVFLIFNPFSHKLNSPQPIAQMAKSMKDNKAIRMLKAAEEGEYGVIGVVSVCPLPTQYPL